MFDIQSYNSFLLAIIIFQLFPGAGTIAILSATATGGIKSGMTAVCGTLIGDFIYMSSAVLGLAAILNNYPTTLVTAQYAGVIYLCYLGLKKLLLNVDTVPLRQKLEMSNWHIFKQSLAICLTNPKAIMFFMAFFPLFLSQEPEPVTLLVLMAHVTAISLVYQTLLVLTGNSATKFLSKWKYSKVIATRIAGLALIGFGIKLVKDIK